MLQCDFLLFQLDISEIIIIFHFEFRSACQCGVYWEEKRLFCFLPRKLNSSFENFRKYDIICEVHHHQFLYQERAIYIYVHILMDLRWITMRSAFLCGILFQNIDLMRFSLYM